MAHLAVISSSQISFYVMLALAALTVPCNVTAALLIVPRIRTIAGRRLFVIALTLAQTLSWIIIFVAYRIMYPA